MFDFSSERIWTKLKQEQNVLYQVCAFQVNQKTKRPPRPLIRYDSLDFSETAERNEA